MHKISEYTFDSDRLIIYKSDINNETISIINDMFLIDEKYEPVLSKLTQLTLKEMHPNKIAINVIGICLTNNCNLRCNYCGFSSQIRMTIGLN